MPIDFVIVEMEEDTQTPLLLDRSFLNTAKAIIDVYEGKISFTIDDDKVIFRVNRTSSCLSNEKPIFRANSGKELMQKSVIKDASGGMLEEILENSSHACEKEQTDKSFQVLKKHQDAMGILLGTKRGSNLLLACIEFLRKRITNPRLLQNLLHSLLH